MIEHGFPNGPKADSATELRRGLTETIGFYLRWHSVEGHTQDTVDTYQKRLGLFVKYLWSKDHSLTLDQITPLDVLGFMEHMKAKGNSPATVRSRFMALRAFLAWATAWEFIPVNPALRFKPPTVPRVSKPFLDPQSFEKLLALCPSNTFLGARRQAIIWVFATTGARLKEVAALSLADLDWKSGQIKIRMGKGQKERLVPFHKKAQRAIMGYVRHRRDGLPNLWVTEERGPLTARAISSDMKRQFDRARLVVPDRCHIFRRTLAAHSQRQRVPRQYAMSVMGWSTTAMLDRYTQWMQEEEREAIEAFQELDPYA